MISDHRLSIKFIIISPHYFSASFSARYSTIEHYSMVFEIESQSIFELISGFYIKSHYNVTQKFLIKRKRRILLFYLIQKFCGYKKHGRIWARRYLERDHSLSTSFSNSWMTCPTSRPDVAFLILSTITVRSFSCGCQRGPYVLSSCWTFQPELPYSLDGAGPQGWWTT